ncbi:hypothetical protein AUJ66_07515 [Candidatus Desantisbacteria bacterium CG1_02_38_46]|uniref:Uncharacterized protein n=3 Tax=unclassified Candidatus Desantisiibacteriota TaxID=3106372 RepID=A0A2H9P9G8_9BACT|nr:MAG: hypothetical protein AUJ66_07515 [Candidatus Desantisbacteria bacterium CG1_02_38_46]PIU52206.1 MAG: hypothetical protein COS91_00440 [Candidatus Desantisbacteria bacterium CG07_land_8_20_14_0_80_39_15]PIZ14905.1 MAG: hypothetical protein COY51_07005 [Candidatus Desantisbacteria bacterium CG_4_10_14_0_8_um_filter_39_17]
MKIIRDKIKLCELREIAQNMFGNFVKAVVDMDKELIAFGGELHSDEEEALLEDGSKQENLWGINIYPDKSGDEFIEFDSMINIKPSKGNRSRGVDDPKIKEKIIRIVNSLVEK